MIELGVQRLGVQRYTLCKFPFFMSAATKLSNRFLKRL